MASKEFSKSNSHEENIKVSIDKILGSDTVIKRSKKNAEDHRKALFCQYIDAMLFLGNRSAELDSTYFMDMAKYDGLFYETIETVLKLSYNKKQIDIIYFFLYERIDVEGHILELEDNVTKEPIVMNTPEQLYESLKRFL